MICIVVIYIMNTFARLSYISKNRNITYSYHNDGYKNSWKWGIYLKKVFTITRRTCKPSKNKLGNARNNPIIQLTLIVLNNQRHDQNNDLWGYWTGSKRQNETIQCVYIIWQVAILTINLVERHDITVSKVLFKQTLIDNNGIKVKNVLAKQTFIVSQLNLFDRRVFRLKTSII